MLTGTKRQRLNRHRRLTAAGRDKAAAIAHEQIRHVVRAMVLVHDRGVRIVAHAARAEQMQPEVLLRHRASSDPLRACRLEDLDAAILEESCDGEIAGMFHASFRSGSSVTLFDSTGRDVL